MVEFPLIEAVDLLNKNVTGARTNLQRISDDLDFLKEQITTMEVSTCFSLLTADLVRLISLCADMARVYNWDVQQRKMSDAAAK